MKNVIIVLLLSITAYAQVPVKIDSIPRGSVQLADSVFYDDLVAPATLARLPVDKPATFDPDSVVLRFNAGDESNATYTFQLSHSTLQDASLTLDVHVHWFQTTIDTVAWRYFYSITNVGNGTTDMSVVGNSTGQVFTFVEGQGKLHQISRLFSIPSTSVGPSSIIRLRLQRDGTQDNHGEAEVMSVDVHYPTDGKGSKTEISRYQ